jgi:hypothetical protein
MTSGGFAGSTFQIPADLLVLFAADLPACVACFLTFWYFALSNILLPELNSIIFISTVWVFYAPGKLLGCSQ